MTNPWPGSTVNVLGSYVTPRMPIGGDRLYRRRHGRRRRVRQVRHQVAGARGLDLPRAEIDPRGDDGGERAGQHVQTEVVELIERLGRCGPGEQLRAQDVAQLRHGAGRGDAVPGDVADQHDQPAVAQLERVVPVPADVAARGRLVMRGQLPALAASGSTPAAGCAATSRPRAALPACGGTATRPGGVATPRRTRSRSRPRLAALADDLAPPLERLARAEPDRRRPR